MTLRDLCILAILAVGSAVAFALVAIASVAIERAGEIRTRRD